MKLEFLDGIEKIENAAGSPNLDKFGAFRVATPPREGDVGNGVEREFPPFHKLTGCEQLATV
jgi:hypothetical protein